MIRPTVALLYDSVHRELNRKILAGFNEGNMTPDDNRTHHEKAVPRIAIPRNRRSENRFCRLFSSALGHH